MKYRESQKDNRLRRYFLNDYSHAHLRAIRLSVGELRGLNALNISFDYPITAIAGKNGAGKSTILALACCAYHNDRDGFKLAKRKQSYYTFSDFFIQHADEVPPQGVVIYYDIAYDNWKTSENDPNAVEIGTQVRWKSQGGKWNDYADRVRRNVIFLGIERIVPHSERSQSRSYSRAFKDAPPKGWEKKVREAVGKVLGKTYGDFRYLGHSKYALPVVKSGGVIYSGFNMGAGESALFEIFSTIYAAGEGSLLVLDEVELGLHSEAQKKFIDQLKDVCLEMKSQVICTTHSKEVFECLPPDARFFVERVNGVTRITGAVSSDFAFSKMSEAPVKELEVLVEDDVAKSLVLSLLPTSTRSRVAVKVIGSAAALARQLAAIYVRGEDKPVLAVFDGDQRVNQSANFGHARNMTENPGTNFDDWLSARAEYLPGDTWPEAWVVRKARASAEALAHVLSCDSGVLRDVLESGLQAGKHSEFFEIARALGLGESECLSLFTNAVCREHVAEFVPLKAKIENILAANS